MPDNNHSKLRGISWVLILGRSRLLLLDKPDFPIAKARIFLPILSQHEQ